MGVAEEKIQSIRQTLNGGYRKPDVSVMNAYIEALAVTPEAIEYLKSRNIKKSTAKYFKLGYSKDYNAISIPVFKNGELINMRYRSIDPNSEQRYTQERGCEVWLYHDEGIKEAKEKKGILIVEGEFDLMSVWQAGIKNVVSPASGKNSYGPWIELVDPIPKVYVAYDNDAPGKQTAYEIAERIGVDKSFEVTYPEGVKDANEYFNSHTDEDFKGLLKAATPYYKRQFADLGSIIDGYNGDTSERIQLGTVPFVKFKKDWLVIYSGDSNVGKTTYVLNIANELANKGTPVLVLPIERGMGEVGERFLQVRYRKQEDDLAVMQPEEWAKIKEDAVDLPLYFAEPDLSTIFDVIRRAKRIFGVKHVIVDHLDYLVHGDNAVQEQAKVLRSFKDICKEQEVIVHMVHHINKPNQGRIRASLSKEDMKGASALYQIPEAVVLLMRKDNGNIEVKVDKNKGPQGSLEYKVDMSIGQFTSQAGLSVEEMRELEEEAEEAWKN